MHTYDVTLTGTAPLLMHMDNIPWADDMDAWKIEAAKKKGTSRAGDDRTPAWRWIGTVYQSDGLVTIPADNLARCLLDAGSSFLVPGAKQKTFKEQTQSGMMIGEPYWPLLIDGKQLPMAPITKLLKSDDFAEHRRATEAMGFSLFVKRAKIGAAKHVRVRPRFDRWSVKGTVAVWDPQITPELLQDIFSFAGARKGLGDWRPSSPRVPGPFGRFEATVIRRAQQ